MTQYLLSVYGDEAGDVATAPEDMQRLYGQVDVLNSELKDSGAWCSPAASTRRAPRPSSAPRAARS
jgi:hypothetical protein